LLDEMIANIDRLSKDFDRLATSSYSFSLHAIVRVRD